MCWFVDQASEWLSGHRFESEQGARISAVLPFAPERWRTKERTNGEVFQSCALRPSTEEFGAREAARPLGPLRVILEPKKPGRGPEISGPKFAQGSFAQNPASVRLCWTHSPEVDYMLRSLQADYGA